MSRPVPQKRQSEPHQITKSALGLHVGNGKCLFAVCVEVYKKRRWSAEILYFAAKSEADVRAHMVRSVKTLLPKGSKVVGVAPAIGFFHDEQGNDLTAE